MTSFLHLNTGACGTSNIKKKPNPSIEATLDTKSRPLLSSKLSRYKLLRSTRWVRHVRPEPKVACAEERHPPAAAPRPYSGEKPRGTLGHS